MENAGSDALSRQLVTLITMSVTVPTLAASGVPLRVPFPSLKLAHAGLFVIAKRW
jgi:hypothetical protein